MKRAVLTLLLITAATGRAATGVSPFLSCVSYNASTNLLTAIFGYVSSNSGTVLLAVGPENFVSPDPQNRGQPTAFSPGANTSAWQTTFDVTQTAQITWTLLGQSVTASNDPSSYCSSCVCPAGPEGPPGPFGMTGNQGLPGSLPAIRNAVASSATNTAIASCKIGETVVGGAGSCSSTTVGVTSHLAVSMPSGLTWKASCDTGRATAVAICASDPALLPPSFPH
jgi:hypothetical protein